jgi:hypothetical protein
MSSAVREAWRRATRMRLEPFESTSCLPCAFDSAAHITKARAAVGSHVRALAVTPKDVKNYLGKIWGP